VPPGGQGLCKPCTRLGEVGSGEGCAVAIGPCMVGGACVCMEKSEVIVASDKVLVHVFSIGRLDPMGVPMSAIIGRKSPAGAEDWL